MLPPSLIEVLRKYKEQVAIIGHVSAAIKLDIYSHVTDTKHLQVGGKNRPQNRQNRRVNAKDKSSLPTGTSENAVSNRACQTGKRKKFNVYAKSHEENEIKLAEMIE